MSSEAPRSTGLGALAILLLTAAALVGADQLTKALVVDAMEVGERIEVIGDLIMLWHVQNTGGAFSLLPGQLPLMYAVTVLALVMIAWFHRSFVGRAPWVMQVVLGMILAGTLGNLIDRVRQGYVTDFLSMGFGDTRFPTYNVADASLTIGIAALVIYLSFADPRRREAAG
ncbi:MAG TPA: signal peptidase II [candidate division Zixibacteria bacterium]|nr:signal peptidase II [candidate division Zixibacteria bacterium]